MAKLEPVVLEGTQLFVVVTLLVPQKNVGMVFVLQKDVGMVLVEMKLGQKNVVIVFEEMKFVGMKFELIEEIHGVVMVILECIGRQVEQLLEP